MRYRWRFLAAEAASCAVFGACFALYHLPMGAVIYPAGGCCLIWAGVLAGDYCRQRQCCKQLALAKGYESVQAPLPWPPMDEREEAYRQLIDRLQRQQCQIRQQQEDRYRDTTRYYTLWAHQIKTPISSMQLQLKGEDTPRARSLYREVLRIEQYVQAAMADGQLNGQGSDYVIRPCQVDSVVRRAVKRLSGEFIARGIALKYTPVQQQVVSDEMWLEFVVEQLLTNALKYTPSGYIKIYMTNDKVLCIQDTGIGIAPSDLPRVFEQGYTGQNGHSGRGASGIGLYLCRRILQNLGHQIQIVSQVGQGCLVKIDLQQHQITE